MKWIRWIKWSGQRLFDRPSDPSVSNSPMAAGTSASERQANRLLGRDQRTGHQMTFQTDDIWLEPFPQITATSASPASVGPS
jgi:hypothetical protein